MILSDYHVHTAFSSDSEASMEEMIQKAISLGFDRCCFTDHMDLDFPAYEGWDFVFDCDEYFDTLKQMEVKYGNKIKIIRGIEMGIKRGIEQRASELVNRYPFDFVIASSHLIDNVDPYLPEFWENKTEEEAVMEYFESILQNVANYKDFDVYGHLDYIIRYSPYKGVSYQSMDIREISDKVLTAIIEAGKGIEINTASLRKGFLHPHPRPDILKRYFELGGEIITIGSDAHSVADYAADLKYADDLLDRLGISYYTVFENRTPIMVKR
ncbi:MAG: histidinol-phosphatase HisJ family protein [Lachnospiraceae bacterium]|nr:histidinol-phosphatase HisJ family protein [Lachnospiraceae bacterium]